MYLLSYYQNERLVESWTFPSMALCRWKIRQLRASSHKTGDFKIEQI